MFHVFHIVYVYVLQNLGRPHSPESRAKISEANKGKVPWNAGKKHSDETKRRIAEKTKEAMLKKKAEKAEILGMTVDEYEAMRLLEKKKKSESGCPQ